MTHNKKNTGICNSGNYNSGHCNSGDYNSGHYNSGACNSGLRNSGNYNSGSYNSGNYNSGNYNSGHYNSGYFNTNEPTVRLFNKDTGLTRDQISIPYIYLPVSEWVCESSMTELEKTKNPTYKTTGGYTKKLSYKEAWKVAWGNITQETKDQFLSLPNFDADIFLEITGIETRTTVKEPSCNGKIVEIDGKKYKLTEI